MKKRILFHLVACLALAACGEKESAPAEPAGHALSSVPAATPGKEGAVDVAAARALAPGSPVVLRARLIGAADVFAVQQAMVILGDPALVKPNYAKPTPYLACCTPPEVKAAHTITAQVVGEDGLPLPHSLKGLHGLAELDYVVISGTVAPESTPQAPLINIATIEKVQPWVDGDAPAAAPCCE